jgi:hypothetical protein
MTGAFATFSYLVFNIFDVFINIKIYVNVHCHLFKVISTLHLLALRLKQLQCCGQSPNIGNIFHTRIALTIRCLASKGFPSNFLLTMTASNLPPQPSLRSYNGY